MTIIELINLGSCGVGSVLGTGSKKGCLKQLTSARALWAFAPGSGLSGSLTKTSVQLLQAQGKLIVMQGVNTFEENGDGDNVETLDDTTQIVTNEGKYKFMATFTNGLDFHAALQTIKGFGNWNFAIVTSKGDIFGTEGSGDIFTGFDTGMIQPEKLTFGTTSTGQKEGISFQFLDRAEVDSDFALIEKANLDFDPRKIEGINECVVSYVTTPANSDTSVKVKVTLKDRKTAVSGLAYSDFTRIYDGATFNPTADDSEATGSGIYVLTVGAVATGKVETIELYDAGNNRDVILIAEDLYQSPTVTATTSA